MIEFLNHKNTVDFIYSVRHNLLIERFDVAGIDRYQCHSYIFYKRITVENNSIITRIFELPRRYFYHIDNLRVTWTQRDQATFATVPYLQIIPIPSHKELMDEPCPINLITTPAEINGQTIRYVVKTNYTLFLQGKIKLQISGHDSTQIQYIDLIIDGLRIPTDLLQGV